MEDLHLFELEAHLLVIFDDRHEEQCFAAVVAIVVLTGNIIWRDEADLVIEAQRFLETLQILRLPLWSKVCPRRRCPGSVPG